MDLTYLQDMYERINSMDVPGYTCVCPQCGQRVEVPVNFLNAGA